MPGDLWLKLLEAQGIPAPTPEFRFHPKRKWRFDWAWGEPHKVAIEQEGGVWTRGRHTRGKGYIADLEKYNHAALMGWRVLRFTPQQIANGQAIDMVLRAFGK